MKMSEWFSDPFLNRLMLYVFTVSLILGVWTYYEEEKELKDFLDWKKKQELKDKK